MIIFIQIVFIPLFSSGTAATVVNGIAVTAGTIKNIYRNKIYNLQTSSLSKQNCKRYRFRVQHPH
jgi:hypothetical protein